MIPKNFRASHEAARERTRQRLDDIEDLVAHGESLPLAIKRVGLRPVSASDLARRNGRVELSRRIDAATRWAVTR